ncbi:MAG: diguanylate cyclase [Polyangiales bacterium]
MLQWIQRSVSRQAALIVAFCISTAGLLIWLLGVTGVLPELPVQAFLLQLVCFLVAASLLAAFVFARRVGARLSHLAAVIDGAGPHDDLARIRDLGSDEVGSVGQAVNRLLARLTSIRASMIDQRRELGKAQRELELTARLADKTAELEQRLTERAVLFDIMQMTSSSYELSEVLRTLVDRVGALLKLRECVMFLYDDAIEAFAVQASYGFKRAEALHGRSLRLGEGISGDAGLRREPVVIADLSAHDGYLGFWGEAERTGSLAAVPIMSGEKLLGVLTGTRPEADPLTDVQIKLLSAIASNAALAIRNAQLFERMRDLSTLDELTGLANQRLLQSHLVREIDRSRRFDKALSLLAVDVDGFRALSEQHGVARTEMALREIAQLLSGNVRKIDTVARVGTAQFMLLLPRGELRDAANVGEKLRKAIAVHPFFDPSESPPNKLTVSVGVATLIAGDDGQGESMLARASLALLSAKQAGKNRVHGGEQPISSRPLA